MTTFTDGSPAWQQFQIRIKSAVSQAADDHRSIAGLLADLQLCEMFLRKSENPVEDLEIYGSPAANEIRDALEAHASEDRVQYDEVCAANVVLAVMNAIARLDPASEP